MWTNYLLYLMGLPEKERNVQIMMIIVFWGIMLIIGYLYEYINTLLKIKNKYYIFVVFFMTL